MPRLGLSLGGKAGGSSGFASSIEVYRDGLNLFGYPNTFGERQWFSSGASSGVAYGSQIGANGGLSITTGANMRHALVHFDCLKDTNALFDMGYSYGAGGQVVYAGVYGHGLYRKTGLGAGGGSGGWAPIFLHSSGAQDANGWTRYRPVDTSIRKVIISNSSVGDANGVYYRASSGGFAWPPTNAFTKVSSGTAASIFWEVDKWYLSVSNIGNVATNATAGMEPNSWVPAAGNATGTIFVAKNDAYRNIPNGKSLVVSLDLACSNSALMNADQTGLRVGLFASDGSYINTDSHGLSLSSFQNYTGYFATYGSRHKIYKRSMSETNLLGNPAAHESKANNALTITSVNPEFSVTLRVSNNNQIYTVQSTISGFGGNGSIGEGTSQVSFTEQSASSMAFDTLVVSGGGGLMDSFKIYNPTASII